MRQACREQNCCQSRADHQPCRLHGKHHRDQEAARLLPGVFAHDRGAHRIVAADADTEDEAEADEPPHIGRQRRGDGAGGEHQDLVTVDPLAAEHVGDAAEQHGADRGGEQRGGGHETVGGG
jgi:hypothetical protein